MNNSKKVVVVLMVLIVLGLGTLLLGSVGVFFWIKHEPREINPSTASSPAMLLSSTTPLPTPAPISSPISQLVSIPAPSPTSTPASITTPPPAVSAPIAPPTPLPAASKPEESVSPVEVAYRHTLDELFANRKGKITIGSPAITSKKIKVQCKEKGKTFLLVFVENSNNGREAVVVVGEAENAGAFRSYILHKKNGAWIIVKTIEEEDP